MAAVARSSSAQSGRSELSADDYHFGTHRIISIGKEIMLGWVFSCSAGFKVCVVGDAEVGKSCLVSSFLEAPRTVSVFSASFRIQSIRF
jgi:hypothetical protein